MVALSTLKNIFKINQSSEPTYLAKRMSLGNYCQNKIGIQAQRRNCDISIDFKLARG